MISVLLACIYVQLKRLDVTWRQIVSMRLRGISPFAVVRQYHRARTLEINISLADCELHQLAGGSLGSVITALDIAQKNGLYVPFGIIAAEDITGSDVIEIVNDALLARARGDKEHHLLLALEHNLVLANNSEYRDNDN